MHVRRKLLQRRCKVRDVRRRDEPRWIHLVCSVRVQCKYLDHRPRVRNAVWWDVSRRCDCRFRVQLPRGLLKQRLLVHADCRGVRRWDLWSVEWCVHSGAVRDYAARQRDWDERGWCHVGRRELRFGRSSAASGTQ